MSGLFRRTFIAASALAAANRAGAATWPEKPVTWIVPFPQGSSADRYARLLDEHISKQLGQPISIDNRTGASGTLAATLFTRAAGDGYTLMVGYTGLTYASVIYPKGGAGFDFAQDFVPISAIAREPLVLVVNPNGLDVASLQELIAAARAQPGSITIGSEGQGTISHLAINLLEERVAVDFKHVPFRASVDQLGALVARRVNAAFLAPHTAASAVTTSRLRAMAIAGRRRDAALVGVPTFDEAGVSDFRVSQWFGLFAPRLTPQSVLDTMHSAVQAALDDNRIKDLWKEQGARVELESRADFTRFVAQEITDWRRVAKAANLQLD